MSLTPTGGGKAYPQGTKVALLAIFAPAKIDMTMAGNIWHELRNINKGGKGAISFMSNEVLDPTELTTVNKRTKEYNLAIKRICDKKKIPVLDANALFADLSANGLPIGTVKLNTTFSGGIFSYDGIHPTQTGYAYIANKFLDQINAEIKAREKFGGLDKPIKLIDLAAVLKADPQNPQKIPK